MQTYTTSIYKIMKRFSFLLGFLFFAHLSYAQITISGQISKHDNQTVENVPVYISGDFDDVTLTDANGEYQFTLPFGGDFVLTPYSNIHPANGVSVYDLFLIREHMLENFTFDSPFQYIAADIDHSEAVDGADTILLRNFLLNINGEFPGNTSWRFIDAAFVFPNPNNPFVTNFPESIVLNNITGNVENLDFKAIKIGDINLSAISSLDIDPCDISCGHVSGNIFHDLNMDCSFDASEARLKYWTVKVEGDYTAYGTTNESGDYSIPVFPGEYTVSVVPVNELWEACQTSHMIAVEENEEVVIDFPIQSIVDCPAMVVDMEAPFLRRCFSSKYYLEYCNHGTMTATDAYVEVTIDSFLTVTGSSMPFTALGGNVYSFEVGDLGINECGNFIINVDVSCDAVLGQTHCSEATVFPDSICTTPSALWDGSDLEVSSNCEGDSIFFTIRNLGDPMIESINFIVIEDDMIMRSEDIQLGANELVSIMLPANGSTWRMEVEQSAYHPHNLRLSESVEGCGVNGDGIFSIGFITPFQQFTAGNSSDIHCSENIGSYDPNDKSASPAGFGPNNLIRENTDIEYKIRFQNTGTDTAFNVVIQDTLSDVLDVASIRPLASSHTYNYKLLGENVVQFSFNNIMLPDSNVNQVASNGFVKFKVAQVLDLPFGTSIENNAAIYFDFNEPVITNTVKHIVGEYFVNISSHSIDRANVYFNLKVIPNPVKESAILQLEGISLDQGVFKLYNSVGQLIKQQSFMGTQLDFMRENLSNGLYLFSIEEKGQLLSHGKLIVN